MFYTKYIELCKKNNKKPYSVLHDLNLPSANLNRWKTGSTPNVYVIYDIAKYFHLRIEDLIDKEYL